MTERPQWRCVFRVRGFSLGRRVKAPPGLDAQHKIHCAQVAAARARLDQAAYEEQNRE